MSIFPGLENFNVGDIVMLGTDSTPFTHYRVVTVNRQTGVVGIQEYLGYCFNVQAVAYTGLVHVHQTQQSITHLFPQQKADGLQSGAAIACVEAQAPRFEDMPVGVPFVYRGLDAIEYVAIRTTVDHFSTEVLGQDFGGTGSENFFWYSISTPIVDWFEDCEQSLQFPNGQVVLCERHNYISKQLFLTTYKACEHCGEEEK